MANAPSRSVAHDHGRPMNEQSLVGGDSHAGAVHLAPTRLAAQLPGDLAHLRDRLGGDGLTEAGQPAARIHRDASTQLGGARSQQRLRLALTAQTDVLVPVEL